MKRQAGQNRYIDFYLRVAQATHRWSMWVYYCAKYSDLAQLSSTHQGFELLNRCPFVDASWTDTVHVLSPERFKGEEWWRLGHKGAAVK